ncbi:hypothetical protein LUZ60_012087 [Juncus effusus]|nr:hypothetical protein LUZ60_012087 [Juncus effusus]
MWQDIPQDILLQIFSFLPPSSLARAFSVCKQWQNSSHFPLLPPRYPPWFLFTPSSHSNSKNSYFLDPQLGKWHTIPMDFFPQPLRLVSSLGINGLLLMKLSSSPSLRLVICNPFTRHFQPLPDLLVSRSNPAIGLITNKNNNNGNSTFYFCIIVAGGASGGSYEQTMEIYDSRRGSEPCNWQLIGSMPAEFTVRLTVWTPNESVHTDNGYLYWMTSARAYSVVRLERSSWTWSEVKLPMANRLDWAGLFKRRNGKLGLVGGESEMIGQVWELEMNGRDEWWVEIDRVPLDLEMRFREGLSKGNVVRCGGAGEAAFLYRGLGSGMIIWAENGEKLGWNWIDGNCEIGFNIPFFKASSVHPSLS